MPVKLTDDLLIGLGDHKKVYMDPRDGSRCIKILQSPGDMDWKRELRYRRSRDRRRLSSSLLTSYYGTVATTLGEGLLFERVTDYDGSPSRTIQDILSGDFGAPDCPGFLRKVLSSFRDDLFRERIITSNMEAANFLVQRRTIDKFRVRIVDNIGSPVKIPLIFYLDALALDHVRRYWQRFITDTNRKFPDMLPDDVAKALIKDA